MEQNSPMFKLVIASGKGGTGKTTVAVNLALALSNTEQKVQLLDCDVEEPNAHLFLKPQIEAEHIIGIPVPEINRDRCSYCGRCSEICVFKVLSVFSDQVMILPELCHGCGSCSYLCPEKAITEVERSIGVVEKGSFGELLFAHGRLNPGEAMSPPLINAVKKLAAADRYCIIDAPPGTSCSVVSAVNACDYCLLVTEPTPFGLNDLDLAFRMVKSLGIPAGVVINRCDLGYMGVENYCRQHNLPVLEKIPFDRELAEMYARGEPVVKTLPRWKNIFLNLNRKILQKWEEAKGHEKNYCN
jgi:MinD superfamily P-loop ATPase